MIQKLYRKGNLVYDGETLYGKPHGRGTVYWENGQIRQEGIFDIKGLTQGRICFENGQTRFEGKLAICSGYGPNYPVEGRLYNDVGCLIYEGKFEITKSGLGYPFVKKPAEFGPCSTITGIPVTVWSYADERRAWEAAGETPPPQITETILQRRMRDSGSK